MRRSLQWLQPTGAYLWRMLSGMPPGGVPRPDAGSLTPGHRRPPPVATPRRSGNPFAEMLWDFREIRAEWHQVRVRRALGRELLEVERLVLAEHDAGEPPGAGADSTLPPGL